MLPLNAYVLTILRLGLGLGNDGNCKGSLKNFGPRRQPERLYFMIFSLWSWRPFQKTHHPIAARVAQGRGGDTPITERRLQRSGKKSGQELIESPHPSCFIEGDVAWKRAKSWQSQNGSLYVPLDSIPTRDGLLNKPSLKKWHIVAPLASWGACRLHLLLAFWNEFQTSKSPIAIPQPRRFLVNVREERPWNFTNRFMFDIIRMAIIWRDIPLSKTPPFWGPPRWAAGAVELRPWYPFWSRCRKRKPREVFFF